MLTLTSPTPWEVIQRNGANVAYVTVAGQCSLTADLLECRFIPIQGGTAVTQQVTPISGLFSADCLVTGGWYALVVIELSGMIETDRKSVAQMGVGEVFLVAGHSVASGDGTYTLDGSSDPRVVCIPNDPNGKDAQYRKTGSAADLPIAFGPYASGVFPAPFGERTHFWAKFGEQVAQTLNVPVFLMNAAWGGTSLEHWAKSSQGQPMAVDGRFPGWKDDSLNFPYANVKNALSRYVSLTGIRAILCDHGQNDWPQTDAEKIVVNYKTWVQQAKLDLGDTDLPFVFNRQTPMRTCPAVRVAQERMAKETVGGFAGPDYDAIMVDSVDRYDGIHLTTSGQTKAAKAWAESVTSADFLAKANPYQPKPVPAAAIVPISTTVPVMGELVGYQPAKKLVNLDLSFLAGMGLIVVLIGVLAYALRPKVVFQEPLVE